MVLRVNDIGKWKVLKVGEALPLQGRVPRRVRLDVNCPAPTRFDVLHEGTLTFLGVVQGMETIEFHAPGEVDIVPTSADEVWYTTMDGESTATEHVDAVNLAKLANRRARNPDLERMMYKMEQNIMRRMTMQASERAAAEARLEQEANDGEVGDGPDTGNQGEATPAPAAPAAAPDASGPAAEPAEPGAPAAGTVGSAAASK